MTSLSGFEALVQGVKVVTWGQPFYAGWGLTLDMNPLKRRTKKLTLASLVYLTLARYPSYIDWKTGLWSSPEKLIATLSQQKKAEISATNFWQRTTIKMKVLFQIIINK
jgi:capsular polysaccharide export protein